MGRVCYKDTNDINNDNASDDAHGIIGEEA